MALDPPAGWLATVGSQFTASDAWGHYRFERVDPGSHIISVQQPAHYRPTTGLRAKVLTTIHEITLVDFGFYRLQASLYLPLLWVG